MGALTEGKEKRPAITEKQLFETCDNYFKQFKKGPTQTVIIDLIGGSPVTVGPLLRKWKEKRENDEQAKLDMPDHIRDGGMTIIATWWQSIQPTINDIITTAEEIANKKVTAAEGKLKDAITEQEDLEQKNSKLEYAAEQKLTEHEEQIEVLNKEKKDHVEEYRKLKEKLFDAEVAKAKIEGKLEAIEQQAIEQKPEKKEECTPEKELEGGVKEQESVEPAHEKSPIKKVEQSANSKNNS